MSPARLVPLLAMLVLGGCARPADGPGSVLYADACGPCHDRSGDGRQGQAPSIRRSAYLAGRPEALIRIVLDGFRTDEAERTARYALPMPSWRILDDADVAALVTFVRTSWGADARPVTAEDVAAVRIATRDRSHPWTPAELDPHPAAEVAR
jgi:mono/diheme cytochrome c family protein